MIPMEQSLDRSLKSTLEFMQSRIMNATSYMGIETWKNPLDLWVYQELITELKPDVIIEIGNHRGGSTLALAHICDALNHGQVIGIDIDQSKLDEKAQGHFRISFLEGDACSMVGKVESLIHRDAKVLVIEDSSHTYQNTLDVLKMYQHLVKPGGYFIVEDSICGHGLDVGPKPGPYEAIAEFLNLYRDFESDRTRESFGITWNPTGFLHRIK